MKKIPYVFLIVVALISVLVSACAGSASVSAPGNSSVGGGSKPLAMPVAFTGVIESIDGNQWSINGQTITVDPAVLQDRPFKVGDTVKMEVQVQADGSMVVNSVEIPAPPVAADSLSSPIVSGTPESSLSSADMPEPVSNSTPEPGSGNTPLDDKSNEAFGTVTSINGNTIVIGGQTYQIANNAEIKNQIQNGASVKVHFILNADGSMTITEIENSTPAQTIDDNSSKDNSGIGSDDNSGSGSGSVESNNNSGSGSSSVESNKNSGPGSGSAESNDNNSGSGSGSNDSHDSHNDDSSGSDS
jgi:hypothetical protein